MEILLVFLCCGSLVITTAFGLGITFVLERFLGIWAYVAGALIPVVIFTALYTLYHIYVRATPCEPVGSLVCGEPFIVAFFLFLAVAFVILLANVLAQTSLYFLLYGRRQTFSAALYGEQDQEPGAEPETPETAADQETEPGAEILTEQVYVQETDFSGLPPDAPEEEPNK